MKLTHERLKQIIKEELQSMQEADEEQQSMQEADEEQQTLESIKTDLYNLHSQLAQDGVNFKSVKVTDPKNPTVVYYELTAAAAAELQKNSKTAFEIMDKLRDLLITRDALAGLRSGRVKRI
jgi:DNA-binding PadR family transcriptional regulator